MECLKLLNGKGEFIDASTGAEVLKRAADESFAFAGVDRLGTITENKTYLQKHIDAVLRYPLIDKAAIEKQQYKVVVDCINSTGALVVPRLLQQLGVAEVIVLNGEVNGRFAHNPEPLPQHLTALSNEVVKQKAHFGIAVDPDVDRLCFVCEDGSALWRRIHPGSRCRLRTKPPQGQYRKQHEQHKSPEGTNRAAWRHLHALCCRRGKRGA
jgi:phosphomannomutase